MTAAIVSTASAANLYWDTNGATAGAGNSSADWDTGFNWSTSADGNIPQVAWTDGETAVFSAGTDATNFTATVTGTVSTPSIVIEEAGNTVTLAGGTINIGGGSIDSSALGAATDQNVVISAELAGAGGLTINAHGDLSALGGGSNSDLSLTGTNTFSGGLSITGGLVSWADDSSFGDAGNSITLSNFGGLLAPASIALGRDLAIDPSGGTLRTYGSATLTLDGVISGSGDINRTDGGTLILTNSANSHSGTWNLQGGVLRLNGGASLGTADINNGTRVDFFNDATAAAYSNDISGAGTTRFESADGTTYSGTISGSGAILVGDVTNDAQLNLASGADLTVGNFWLGESTSVAGNVTQETGTAVEVTNQMRVGHWSSETSVYNMEGGTLDLTGTPGPTGEATGFETAGTLMLGVDGTGIFNQTGGTVTTAGVGLDIRGNTGGTDQYNLDGGTLIVGSKTAAITPSPPTSPASVP